VDTFFLPPAGTLFENLQNRCPKVNTGTHTTIK